MARVLVVEDDLDTLSALVEALSEEGWEVVPAASADQARVAVQSRAVDIVLCDVLLGNGAGGLAVREGVASPIPFVFMTASPPEVASFKGEYVLRKPFGTAEVVGVLRQLLAARA